MIILDEKKLKNRTIRMIGEDYGIIVSDKALEHPEWYESELDDIIEKFYFDVDEVVKSAMDYIKEEWPSIKGN